MFNLKYYKSPTSIRNNLLEIELSGENAHATALKLKWRRLNHQPHIKVRKDAAFAVELEDYKFPKTRRPTNIGLNYFQFSFSTTV